MAPTRFMLGSSILVLCSPTRSLGEPTLVSELGDNAVVKVQLGVFAAHTIIPKPNLRSTRRLEPDTPFLLAPPAASAIPRQAPDSSD